MGNQFFQDYLNSLSKRDQIVALQTMEKYFDSISQNVKEIKDGSDAFELLKKTSVYNEEHFSVIYLTNAGKVIKTEEVSMGGLTSVLADVRVIIKGALLCNSTAIIVSHNHPSGSLKPSRQDDYITEQIKNACVTMSIHLMDHIIVGENAYYSYQDHGRII